MGRYSLTDNSDGFYSLVGRRVPINIGRGISFAGVKTMIKFQRSQLCHDLSCVHPGTGGPSTPKYASASDLISGIGSKLHGKRQANRFGQRGEGTIRRPRTSKYRFGKCSRRRQVSRSSHPVLQGSPWHANLTSAVFLRSTCSTKLLSFEESVCDRLSIPRTLFRRY